MPHPAALRRDAEASPCVDPHPALIATGSQTDDAPTEPHRQRLHVLPLCDDLDLYGATSDLSSPCRLCDCIMCTSHLLYLSQAGHTTAEVWGMQLLFVHLMLVLPPSSSTLRRHLDDIIQQPDFARVACSCDSCKVHRCLVRAYRHANALALLAQSDDSHWGHGDVT